MSNSVESPTPGEMSGDQGTTQPTAAEVAAPAELVPPNTAAEANGDDQPDVAEEEAGE